jgi:transcriptional regulator with XRE-family HTH domain
MSETKRLRRLLGDWVRKHREAKKLSQDGLAGKVDMERQQIYRIENGISGTKQETILRIAKVLEADENEALTLLAGIEPQNEAADSHDILDKVQIVFQDGNKLTKKQQQEILDAARLIARGVMAERHEDKGE